MTSQNARNLRPISGYNRPDLQRDYDRAAARRVFRGDTAAVTTDLIYKGIMTTAKPVKMVHDSIRYNRPDLQRDYDPRSLAVITVCCRFVTTDLIYKGIMTCHRVRRLPRYNSVTTDLIYKGIMTDQSWTCIMSPRLATLQQT